MGDKIQFKDIPTIEGMLSPMEAVEAVKFHATNMANDQSSSMITHARLESLEAVISLVRRYNNKLIEIEESDNG